MRQQQGKVTAQLKLKTLNDNPYLILSYYIQKNLLKHFDVNLVTQAETDAFYFDKHEILHLLEMVCDSVFYNYSLAKRIQDVAHAISDFKKLLLYQRAYYYVYSTLF